MHKYILTDIVGQNTDPDTSVFIKGKGFYFPMKVQ